MRVISKGHPGIRKVLQKQRLRETEYRKMKYTLRADCAEGVLLCNAITGELILLSPAEAEKLDRLPFSDVKWAETLVEDYFLVPVDEDEKQTVDHIRKLFRDLWTPEFITQYVILPTTKCNARCWYCFERGCRQTDMTPETADQLADYMEQHSGGKDLHLKFFGGEPLINMDRMDQLCARLTEKGVRFRSELVTNGYLLTEDVIQRAVRDWHTGAAQITLDGTEETYNRTKAYTVRDASPFQRVMKNIEAAQRAGIHVSIRLNVDLRNADDLMALAEELGRRLERRNVHVYASAIFSKQDEQPEGKSAQRQKAARVEELNSRLVQLGFQRPIPRLPDLRLYHCSADVGLTRVVYPDGRLFVCDFVQEGEEIGCLGQAEEDETAVRRFEERTELPECADCEIYPACCLSKNCPGLCTVNEIKCAGERERQIRRVIGAYHIIKENPVEIEKYEPPRFWAVDVDMENVIRTSGDTVDPYANCSTLYCPTIQYGFCNEDYCLEDAEHPDPYV